ncbi:hypothetical protein CDAR_448921 [Caerostris darwini]|uniref:Uncharacterized protein n=1 Tax=Caerostris darwini TaxID=1538125 RepID=A0AAV4WBN7_9ARAC|nr:hypothetical protein CDAR_448921 [Caerostris darwini]
MAHNHKQQQKRHLKTIKEKYIAAVIFPLLDGHRDKKMKNLRETSSVPLVEWTPLPNPLSAKRSHKEPKKEARATTISGANQYSRTAEYGTAREEEEEELTSSLRPSERRTKGKTNKRGKNGEKGVETKCFTSRMCKRRSLDGNFSAFMLPGVAQSAPLQMLMRKGLRAEEGRCE